MEYILRVRSRHPSVAPLRRSGLHFPARAVYRHGSTAETEKIFPISVKKGRKILEINTAQSVRISANKLLMKQAFDRAGVSHAQWAHGSAEQIDHALFEHGEDFKIVAKHIYGSRGTGNYLLENRQQFLGWAKGRDLSRYIVERFYNYSREYRLHVSRNGCFYGIRKMLKSDTPQADRWSRHDDNSVWIMDTNPAFEKPTSWTTIEQQCVLALVEEGLDVAAFDVKVQSSTHNGNVREFPQFILLESNSAPSFGTVTTERYLQELPKIVDLKLKA